MKAHAMRAGSYRRDQYGRRYESHVARVNELVDRLRDAPDRGSVPYVSPACKGWILR